MLATLMRIGTWAWTLVHGWRETETDDPQLGAVLAAEKDHLLAPDSSNQADWKTWLILENNNPDPVTIAFRVPDQTTKYHRSIILPHEYFAVRVGPENVEFMFRYTERMPRMASAPRLVERVDTEVLEAKYRQLRRF